MKLDLTNKWIRMIVDKADVTNGCSVIRHILWSCVLGLGAVAFGLAALTVFGVMLIGMALMLWAPWYGGFDINLSLSYLGHGQWAYMIRFGAAFGFALTGFAIGVTAVLGLLRLLKKAANWKYPRIQRAMKVLSPVSAVFHVVAESASAIGHKFCPNVVIDYPPDFAALGIAPGREYYLNGVQDEGSRWIMVDLEHMGDRIYINSRRPGAAKTSFWIKYTYGIGFDETFTMIPVEETVTPV